jgi:dienelactone hydrolase
MHLRPLLRIADERNTHVIANPEQWDKRRSDIHSRFAVATGKPPYEIPPPSETAIVTSETLERYERHLIEYSVESDERVRAWLLIPHHHPSPGPAVLCLHQTVAEGKDEPVGISGTVDLAYAHHLAELGFTCLVPDHITAGDRMGDGLAAYDTSQFYERHPAWSAVGKAIWDGQRALDVLESLEIVDPQRIGAIGHSLGGHSSVFLAATDERVAACVSNCGMTTFADNTNRRSWARDEWYIYFNALRGTLRAGLPAPFDFHEIAALIAPRGFLNITALNDSMMGISPPAMLEFTAELRGLYALLGHDDRFSTYLHNDGHSFLPTARALAYTWLDQNLS